MFLQKSEPGIVTYSFWMFVAMHIMEHQVLTEKVILNHDTDMG